jgi:predicted nucleic acid-binding protein
VNTLVVTDTSPLIALDRIGRLDLLPSLFSVCAPPAVVAEFGRRPEWLEVRPVRDAERVTALLEELDQGEAEAIALAIETPGAELLIDEARGRRVALGFGLPVVGTAGILLEAKRRSLITAVRPLLDALIHDHSFHLAEPHYEAVLRQAGEV